MHRNQRKISDAGIIVAFLIILNTIILKEGFISNPEWYLGLVVAIPALIIALFIILPKRRNRTTLNS